MGGLTASLVWFRAYALCLPRDAPRTCLTHSDRVFLPASPTASGLGAAPARMPAWVSWLLFATLLPTLTFFGHWSLRIDIPGTQLYVGFPESHHHDDGAPEGEDHD